VDEQERQWVRLARHGDRGAFTSLVERYWDRLQRWLFALTGQQHLAEDMTQEAFVKAWSSLPTLANDATFRVWLFRIAKNCLLDSQRGPKARNGQPLPEEVHGRETAPLINLLEVEGQQMLQSALERLSKPYRVAYLLWTQEDLPYAEIAEILGVSEETARWRVCKARQYLMKELSAYLDCPRS